MTTKKKKIQEEGLEEEERNSGGVVVVGSTSSTSPPSPGPCGPDRISELPKEILHHILGFLEMDEFLVATTSLVSTKWRNLWKSVSTLKFPSCTTSWRIVDNGGGGGGGGGIRNNVEKYHSFIDHVLRLRDSQASKIQIFRYYSDDSNSRGGGGGGGYDSLRRLHNFIVSAVVNQGAQEIQILMGSYSRQRGDDGNVIIHFNPSIFTSGLLRVFSFAVFDRHFLIQFPRSMCCAAKHLTHLSLAGIRLPEGDDDDSSSSSSSSSNAAAAQLHLVCPLLETLLISNCYTEHLKVLDISAPKLITLCIRNGCMRDEHFDGLGGCRLEIHTPNLTFFDYSGCVFVDCFTDNLPCVTIADLQISKETDMVEKTNSFAIKLLKGLTTARSLILAGFELFSQDTLSGLLTPFTRLRTLGLKSSCKISSIHGMVHILNSCNSIEKFVWEVNLISTLVGDDEHLILPQCRLSHLEQVCIENLHGHENEIEFVKFLLKSSIVLEEIIINTARDSPKISIEENLKQFIEEEPSFRSIKLQIL